MSANVIATCFALVGFTAAIVVGWAAGNSSMTIIVRSLGAFCICMIVGKIVGAVAQRVVDQNIEDYKLANPIPLDPMKAAADAASAAAATLSGSNVDIIEENEPVTKPRSAA